ncbi:hypothetical protein ABZV60_26490 [Streptomyces sp. NPDC004787]|uniref:hypothetical protein n=1 Tax=Streptomyces sp. NPDC004787 TaxID=3154291 RepID=UPI0033A2A38E
MHAHEDVAKTCPDSLREKSPDQDAAEPLPAIAGRHDDPGEFDLVFLSVEGSLLASACRRPLPAGVSLWPWWAVFRTGPEALLQDREKYSGGAASRSDGE